MIYLENPEESIAEIIIDNPAKKNAINEQMWTRLGDICNELEKNQDIRVVIVSGKGSDFSSGADLSDPSIVGMNGLYRMRHLGRNLIKLKRLPKPTIAKVKGVCVGAGLGLALACDLVVCSETARFSEIFALRGLALDGGNSWHLPRLVGLQKAKELAFFGNFISGLEACEIGLAVRALKEDQLDEFVLNWARELAKKPTVALSLTKALLDESSLVSFEDAVENEARSQAGVFATEDAKEAIAAFIQKREPNFKGR
jgi:2-(1,2-epoxy-1,2-dihydrophenyl)acetyl-CoA isomerase